MYIADLKLPRALLDVGYLGARRTENLRFGGYVSNKDILYSNSFFTMKEIALIQRELVQTK